MNNVGLGEWIISMFMVVLVVATLIATLAPASRVRRAYRIALLGMMVLLASIWFRTLI